MTIMMEKVNSVAERLELLSNTAMLKKVLDKNDASSASKGEVVPAFSRYEKPGRSPIPIVPVHAPPASPKSLVSDRSQRRDSVSPHPSMMESTRDSPPYARREHHYQDYHHHYTGASFGYSSGSQYPPFPPVSHSGYGVHGTQMDRYYRENRVPGPLAPLGPHPDQGHSHGTPYTVKENVAPPPPPFRSPYEDRRSSESHPHHHHHHVPVTADSSNRSNKYLSPAISVSEDCEESTSAPHAQNRMSYEALLRENFHMRDQLLDKDAVIGSLQLKVDQLETQIAELRQLPTGKISHIPIDDMIHIMQEYGSEVSNQTLPKRRDNIKKASIVRQFRRWNPEFFRYFIHVNGEWVPKLGREAELRRREEKRKELKRQATQKGTSIA